MPFQPDEDDVALRIAERAAILEFDNAVPRDEADRQALNEYLNSEGNTQDGIYGELSRAAKRRAEPLFQDVDKRIKLNRSSVSAWGWGYVVPDGAVYRPATTEKIEDTAIIVPCFDGCGLVDLVAQGMRSGRQMTRLGAADVLGFDAVEFAKETGAPLLVFRDAYMWLRGHGLGAVVVDWARAADTLNGVTTMLSHADTAPALYAATRDCWPVPTVAVYAPKENRLAA